MSLAIWGMVLPIVALVVRSILEERREQRRLERNSNSNND